MNLPSEWEYGTNVGGGGEVYVDAREIRREVSSRLNDHGQEKEQTVF